MTEIIAQSGFDFQILDCEHGAYDFQALENDIRACNLHGCAPYVRVGGLNPAEVQRCLDLGAEGIVFPQLQHAEDFKKASLLVNYGPDGLRGNNPFVRSWGYGFKNSLASRPLCITIIESLSAVDELDAILQLPGIDMIYIGSYDLSAQLGCPGEIADPKVLGIVKTIIAKSTAASVAVGLMIADTEQYNAYRPLGATVFLHTVDSDQLKKGFTRVIKQLKENTPINKKTD